MRASFAGGLLSLLLLSTAARASPREEGPTAASTAAASERGPRVAVTANLLAVRDGGLGLAMAWDPVSWLRLGAGAGGLFISTVQTTWMMGTVGGRVLEIGREVGFRLRLLPTLGVLRTTAKDKQGDGPGPSSRDTLAATTTLELDTTYCGESEHGFTVRGSAGAAWVLSQERSGDAGSAYGDAYSVAPLVMLAAGYAF